MRKILIYIICGLMTLAVFLPVALKAADSNETTSPAEEKIYGVQFKLIKTNGSIDNIGYLKDYVSLSNPEMPNLKEDFLNLFNSTDTNTYNPRFISRSYTFDHAFDIEYYTVLFKNGRKITDLSDIKELKSDDLNPNATNLLIWVHAKIKNGYKVYFDPKNGEKGFTTETAFASKVKESPKDPTRDGYKFLGWYDGDKIFRIEKDFIYEDTTLTAKWEKVNLEKYNVSFVLDQAEIPNQEVEFDTNATEPKVDPKEGYEFDGWYTDSGFTSKFDFSSPIKSNLTLYARWNKIETENPNPDDDKDPDENPGGDQEPGDDKDPDENPGETEEPGEDEKENPDQDKKPEDNKDSDDQKNPDIDDNPNKNNRPSYDYNYDYYDYYWHPNYDYLNSNRNNSSDIAKNKDDKDEEKTKDENKEETIEEKVTIPEAILNSYFSDIGDLPGHYQEAIIDLANRSVLIGTDKNNFDPHTSISRAMVAQVLYRLANDKTYVNPSDFTDVSPTNWFYTAVNWANEKGLVRGFKGKTFKPNKSITNEELAVILARAIENLELKTSNINSINKDNYKFLSDWNRDGIVKMLELGLMDFSFEGNQVVVKEISRAEFSNIIYKLINSLN